MDSRQKTLTSILSPEGEEATALSPSGRKLDRGLAGLTKVRFVFASAPLASRAQPVARSNLDCRVGKGLLAMTVEELL